MNEALPQELLVQIFELSGEQPVKLSAVCASWRQAALNNAAFWTNIVVADAAAQSGELERVQTLAGRARAMPLRLTRTGHTMDDELAITALDELVLDVLPRCASFAYIDMRDDRAGSRRAFIERLLRTPAPHLQELRLHMFGYSVQHRSTMSVRVEDAPLPAAASSLPALRSLVLEKVCIPLQHMDFRGLERIVLVHDCYGLNPCALGENTALVDLLSKILHASPRLKEFDVLDMLHPPSRLRIADALHPSLERLSLRVHRIEWPASDSMARLDLPRLTTLSLLIGIEKTSVLLSLLERTPALVHLTLRSWVSRIPQAQAADPAASRVLLARLETLHIDEVVDLRLGRLLELLELPALELLRFTVNNSMVRLVAVPPLPVRSVWVDIGRRDLAQHIAPALTALPRVETLRISPLFHHHDLRVRRDAQVGVADILAGQVRISASCVTIVLCDHERLESTDKDAADAAMRAWPGLRVTLEPCALCLGPQNRV